MVGKNGKLVFNGYKVAVFQDEKRSEMGGNDCPMIRMY
jgi:hypothetical protein